MVFLIEYDRQSQSLLTYKKFEERELAKAQAERLELELNLHRRGISHEVVILMAEREADLRRTHLRYFEDVQGILSSTLTEVERALQTS